MADLGSGWRATIYMEFPRRSSRLAGREDAFSSYARHARIAALSISFGNEVPQGLDPKAGKNKAVTTEEHRGTQRNTEKGKASIIAFSDYALLSS
jgi:hypothetical protein